MNQKPQVSANDRSLDLDGGPRWDERTHTLYFGPHVVKRFTRPAPSQQLILMAFQEEGWPVQICDPLVPEPGSSARKMKWRLRSAVSDLNRAQHTSLRIRFHMDGTGQGICWKLHIE